MFLARLINVLFSSRQQFPADDIARAVSLISRGRHNDAAALLAKHLGSFPTDGVARQLLASIALGQGRAAEALAHLDAIGGTPTVEASFMRADALRSMGRVDEALTEYRQLLQRAPEFAPGHSAYGTMLSNLRRWDEAVAALRTAYRLDSESPVILNNLGNALRNTGEMRAAVGFLEKAIARSPGLKDALQSRLFLLHYLPEVETEVVLAAHREFNELYAAPLSADVLPHTNVRDTERKLRIGYVSGDFGRHPVGYLIKPVIEAHDRNAVSVFCYSTLDLRDDLRPEIELACDGWREVDGMDDAALADIIRSDRIDILVDLAGHSRGERLLAFARRPAPVQVTWLGYVETTGMDAIDYIIVDPFLLPPPGSRQVLSETPLVLPRSYVCYQPPDYAPDVTRLPALDQRGIRFGSFNNPAKLNEAVIALWAQVLAAVPEATLVLKTHVLNRTRTREWLIARFDAHGIAPSRLEMSGGRPEQTFHVDLLGSYGEIDVALDPFPYTGGITTLEALWMGVPVITLAGDTLLSRMGVSSLNAAGLPEFVADTPQAYVQIAVRCGRDLSWLADIREGMRSRLASSPLMDARAFTRDLEAAYRQIWRKWCTSGRPSNPG